jgi:Tfp pilus assembly protein PilV
MSKKNSGTGMIEVVVGSAIILVGIFSILKTYDYYLKFALSHRYDVQATLLAEEGIEVVKLLRDTSWSQNISTHSSGIPYRLAFSNAVWTSTTSTKYIDSKFSRTFVLSDVYRDSGDKISTSGTLDPNTKKVAVFVAVRNIFGTTTKSISTYITNIFDN